MSETISMTRRRSSAVVVGACPCNGHPKRELHRFADVMVALAERVNAGEVDFFNQAPRLAPMRRLDDT